MNKNKPTTERTSNYNHLEKMSTFELLSNINKEDQTIPAAIEKLIPKIEILVDAIVDKMNQGGRLLYIGAGTSGRLGVLDASECPPTFGVPHDWVIGLIAGGDSALRVAVENAEDNPTQAFKDLMEFSINSNDVLIGIAASGTTPYVIGGLEEANKNNILTACITCSAESPLAAVSKHPIEVIVGPEFLTASTRMKAGTAQKQVLNMISTSVMIKLGRVSGNKMIDMKLSNTKLVGRGVRMLMEELSIAESLASDLLQKHKSVRKAIELYNK
ncbi:MAG: N-acetylmuramic acid 6-phosphate etherase [Flavobacteriaceae bacterium]|nr:MAG: N-acetylmuramic acid 6-phosphate etherase [Flavobacteriaceae bacterium]